MNDAVAVLPVPTAEISGENTTQNDGRFRVGNRYRWQKGMRSPNPGGRPKKLVLSDALQEILEQHFQLLRKVSGFANDFFWARMRPGRTPSRRLWLVAH